MSKIQISVSVIDSLKQNMPEATPATPPPSLKERVEYAGWCLDAGHNRAAAIDFLRKAKQFLEKKHPFNKTDSDLLQVIQSALMDNGYYI